MKIGIDVSQVAYRKTGVANYLLHFVEKLAEEDKGNEFILFYSSVRSRLSLNDFNFKSQPKNVSIKNFRLPPRILDLIWNRLHIIPIESFVGDIDVFITSDWVEPPAKHAKKATIIYDLIVYKYPDETASIIVATQKRKLRWVVKESEVVFCISESTKKDASEILKIDPNKIQVIYPGV